MGQPPPPADPRAIVRALEAAGVRYVVIGGWAAVTYGVDRATFDLDIVVEAEARNASALAEALRVLGARRDLGAGMSEELSLHEPGSLLASPLRAITGHGPLDVLSAVPGGGTYADLRSDARRAAFADGTSFVVASKRDLERTKEAVADEADPARGDRDRLDLEALRALPDSDLPNA